MSVIHGIDDTPLRSHQHYPTDLADYGRNSNNRTA